MAIQKPTNPTEAMFQGLEVGQKLGKDFAAVLENRRQQKEYQVVAQKTMEQLDAIDNQMIIAKNVLDAENEKIRKGEYVSQKDFGAALYGATMGQIELMDKKADILTRTILRHGNNEYVTKNFGLAMEDLLKRKSQVLQGMEGGIQALSTAASVDISAYGAKTQRMGTVANIEQGAAKVDIARGHLAVDEGRLRESSRAARVGEAQGWRGLELKQQEIEQTGELAEKRLGFEERRVQVAERGQEFEEDYRNRELNLKEKQFARMGWQQAIGEATEMAVAADQWLSAGRDPELLARMWTKEDRPVDAEYIVKLAGRHATKTGKLKADLIESDRRIREYEKTAKEGNPLQRKRAVQALQVEREINDRLVEADMTIRERENEARRVAGLEGLEASAARIGQKFGGAVKFVNEIASIFDPFNADVYRSVQEGIRQGKRPGVAAEVEQRIRE